MSGHTPGEWHVHEVPTSISVRTHSAVLPGRRMGAVAAMAIHPLSAFADEGRANARLIAAAPDLLAAAIRVRARCQAMRLDADASFALDALDHAIAKASP